MGKLRKASGGAAGSVGPRAYEDSLLCFASLGIGQRNLSITSLFPRKHTAWLEHVHDKFVPALQRASRWDAVRGPGAARALSDQGRKRGRGRTATTPAASREDGAQGQNFEGSGQGFG